jgi:1-acyl-sn-glycerol-3-phosphate acyltransferase
MYVKKLVYHRCLYKTYVPTIMGEPEAISKYLSDFILFQVGVEWEIIGKEKLMVDEGAVIVLNHQEGVKTGNILSSIWV